MRHYEIASKLEPFVTTPYPYFVIALYLLLLIPAISLSGEDEIPKEKYLAGNIPLNLRIGANAVVRYEKLTVNIESDHEATEQVHRIITILSAEGNNFAELTLPYDKFIKITDIDGTLYDGQGEEVRSLKNNDIKDYSATSDFSLYEDNRMKVVSFPHTGYPYTIEFTYEMEFKGYINLPSWFPEEDQAPVEESKFEVTFPKEATVRFSKNFPIEPVITSKGDMTTCLYTIKLVQPFEREVLGPNSIDQRKSIRIAPEKFMIDGYEGDFSSWNSFGQWFYKLKENRQDIPDKARQEIYSIIANAKDKKDTIRLLYNYLQSKTRYISIQLGIGGWQPFDANYVYKNGYGDCKALTNYMLSLLKAVKIEAYTALIYHSTIPNQILYEFPSNQFNHAILFVPIQEDTIWLECTSQTIPFGHIGPGNENRLALVVGPRGGELVRTPTSKPDENRQTRKATVTLVAGGNSNADIQTFYSGDQQDYVRDGLTESTPKDREEWIKNNISIPAFRLKTSEYSPLENNPNTSSLHLQIELPQYATLAGTRLFFHPNLMEQRTYVPPADDTRKYPILSPYPYLDMDSITYKLPQGYVIEAFPKPVTIETSFAKFSCGITSVDSLNCLYTRRLEIMQTELPPETYNEYRKFFQDVVQADKANAVLVKKN